MDKQQHHLIFLGFFLFVSLGNCADDVPSAPQQKFAVMCLLSNKTTEIAIQCGEDAAINIKSVFQGYQDIPLDTPVCRKQEKNECSVTEPELHDTLVEKCMGRASCLVPVKRIFLNPCGKISDYVQVDYECVPEDSPAQNIVDVCGDILHGESIARKSGYIHTPNYPALYPPDESCMCSLKALKKGTLIKLSVLDMDIHSVDKNGCIGDWLEYTIPGEIWGRGVRMCNATRLNTTYVIGNNIELHFRADSSYESRGFWIKYEGMLESNESVNIRLQCSQYHPTINKEDGTCLSADTSSELFIDCQDVGVIEITGSEHWTKTDAPSCPAPSSVTENCFERIDDRPLMTSCMGQPKCNFPVASQFVPKCQAASNYFEVQYKCVADADEVHNIVDICGDSLKGDGINRKSGFIESPGYPSSYSPNVNCQCRLSTPEPHTTIQLRALDLELTGDASVMCKNDWLEYTTDPRSWNRGIKICDGLDKDQVLDTDKSDIYLNFNTDSINEYRGFWIQYSARRIEENLEVPVKVSCYKWLEGDRITVSDGQEKNPTPQQSSKDNKSNKNIALIVGLTVVILLMLVLCIGMVLYKVKDSRKKYPPSQTTTLDTPLDKSYNSFKRYSTLNEEGKPADPGLRNKGYQMRQEEYQRSALAANQLNLPASYVNPVFDGSPVV